MRALKIALIGVLCVLLCGCDFGVNFWKEADFSFYNEKGKAETVTNEETFFILLAEDQKTYRGMKLGDDAAAALADYRLTDFEYELRYNGRVETEQDTAWHQAAPQAQQLLQYLPQLEEQRLEVYLYCDVYSTDDGYKTVSGLEDRRNVRLAYSFAVRIEDRKITEVSVERNFGQLDEYAPIAE